MWKVCLSGILSRRVFCSRRIFCAVLLLSLSAGGVAAGAVAAGGTQAARSENRFDVREFGAAGDGKTTDTAAIQAAINACAAAGGGKVSLENGTFLSGTLFLKSNVHLYLEAGAVLLGSASLNAYPETVQRFRSYTDNYTNKSLIYAEGQENVSITGRGALDGQGAAFQGPYLVRPYMIRIIECRNVTIRDVTIRNSPMWVQHYLACENVLIDGISVHSKVNRNNDGIDIDSCDKVRIANCEIESGDDAIVLKSTADRVCRNVTITNCALSSDCNAIKLGTESNGGFQNITVSNCAIYDTRLAGIALELVDGGVFDGVTVSNVNMRNVKGGIFVRLGNRARPFQADAPKPAMGSMRNILISNVQATGVGKVGCSITGLPGCPVENVTLENVRIVCDGGGAAEDAAREIPEHPEQYPEFKMFGTLPAYGFYVRHAKNVRFHRLDLDSEKEDQRPALIFDDVEDAQIFDLRARVSPAAPAVVWLKQVRGAFIHGCSPRESDAPFVKLEGPDTDHVNLLNNDFRGTKTIYRMEEGVKKDALRVGN